MLDRIKTVPPWWLLLFYPLLLLCLYLFSLFAENTYAKEQFGLDPLLLAWFFEHRAGWLTRIALALDFLGISYLLGAIIVVLAMLLWRTSRSASAFLLVGFWGVVSLNLVAKAYFARARPDLFEQLTPITNSSFPSGHAMGSWAFWLLITIVVHRLYRRYTWIAVVFGGLFAVGVGVSRSYLQVHYPTDVLAAWALSTAWVLALMVWYTRGSRKGADPEEERVAALPDLRGS